MATFYVSKTGNDSNSGTRDSPVLTIARAGVLVRASAENDSEIIIMDNGTYNEGGIGQGNPTITNTGVTIMAETGSDGLPLVSPVLQGSGSGTTQSYALYCGEGWTVKGITFENYDLGNSADNAVITNRSPANGDDGITVELCTFRHVSGTCVNFGRGSFLPLRHTVKSNTFYDITTKSSQLPTVRISAGTNTRRATVTNNVFYDWQPQNTSATYIFGGTTNSQLPEIIISHNTFGTSSVEANEGSITRAQYGVSSPRSKFEYNIIFEQTMAGTNSSFAQIDNGEANYNIYFNVTGTSAQQPFGRASAPTGSTGNQEIDPQLKSPLVGDNASYRLAGTNSPAFDAAIGSSDVTNDRTGVSRLTLDSTAYGTGIFDIGAYELTGLWSAESPDELSQFGADFTINRIPNADNQRQRALQEGNSSTIGRDVDQVPLGTAINGAVPSIIRKRPTAYKQDSGKKGT